MKKEDIQVSYKNKEDMTTQIHQLAIVLMMMIHGWHEMAWHAT